MYRFQYNLITPIHFTSSHSIIFFTVYYFILHLIHLYYSILIDIQAKYLLSKQLLYHSKLS